MKNSIRLLHAATALFIAAVALSAPTVNAQAQRGGRGQRGTVVMKGAQSSKGVKSEGIGHVLLHGGYYISPTIDVDLNLKHLEISNIADGEVVYVTLEYLNGAIEPLIAGSITVVNGGGTLATTRSLTVNITSRFVTMSLRKATGEVIMSGGIRGIP